MSTKPPKVRESGFYWVLLPKPPRITICRWMDHTETWLYGDWDYADAEVEVLSTRLRPPEANEGWSEAAIHAERDGGY